MSNDISTITPLLFSAQQTVARELTGFIASVTRNFDDKQAALGQTVRVPISPIQAISDYTPSQSTNGGSAGTDRTFTYQDVIITKSQKSTFNMTGEEEMALMSGGNTIAQETFKQSIMQAMRVVANTIESDLSNIYKSASRAVGTAGTTPFGSDLSAAATVLKELLDNGVPMTDWNLVVNTSAGLNLRKQITVTNASQRDGGVAAMGLATGGLWDLYGMMTRESAQVKLTVKGTGTAYVVNGATAAGATSIVVKTGSGTIVAGDVVAINGVNYVVLTGVAAPGTIVIGNPGLLAAAADGDTVTIGNAYRANVGLYRGAAVLVVRPPAVEATPIIQTQIVMDDKTGLPFLVCRLLGDGLVSWRVQAAWGYKVVQSEFLIDLMG